MVGRALRRVNRPDGAFARRVRIDNPLAAYAACCVAATSIVAALGALLVLAAATARGDLAELRLSDFLIDGTVRWLGVTVAGVIAAAPFVPPATLLGARLRIESAVYYAVLGALACAALAFLVFGLPGEHSFGTDWAAWTIAPPCGAAWGGCWWYLHRRWKSEPANQGRRLSAAPPSPARDS